jgi:hypothetical protein
MEQNRLRVLRRRERFFDGAQRRRLLRIQGEIPRSDELLIRMRIARDGLLAQQNKASLLQRAERLVIERNLAQQVGRGNRLAQFRHRLQQRCLLRSTSPQFLNLLRQDLFRGADEQLFLPTDLSPADHLRQKTAHDRFDRAAVVSAHPARQLDELWAERWFFAHERFDRPDPFRVRLCQHSHHCGQRRAFPKRDAHP